MTETGRQALPTGKLAKNTAINIGGRLIPLIVALATIPALISHLGKDSFAILSLAWVLLIYFACLDLGLGQAVTKYVAEGLGKQDTKALPGFVWTSFWLQCGLGIIGAASLIYVVPTLIHEGLNIPFELQAHATQSFYLLAVSLPFVLLSGLFRGVLAGGQYFGVINAIQVPSTCAIYVMALVGAWLGLSLPAIFVLILMSRVVTAGCYYHFAMKLFPDLSETCRGSLDTIKPLFSFGGWLTLSALIGPFLIYSERFLLGSILTLDAVTLFSVPHEIVTRLWILPFGLMAALFPAFSSLSGSGDTQAVRAIVSQALKFLLLVVGPLVFMLLVFSEELLTFWLDADFAGQTTSVMQLLLLGVLFSSLAQLPYTYFQGIGRPEITCYIQLALLPITLVLGWTLISQLGLLGAALTWLCIRILAMVIGFVVYQRFAPFDASHLRQARLPHTAAALLIFGLCLSPMIFVSAMALSMKLAISGVALLFFLAVVWFYACQKSDRDLLQELLGRCLPGHHKQAMLGTS